MSKHRGEDESGSRKNQVRRAYARLADGGTAEVGCCGPGASVGSAPVQALYQPEALASIPADVSGGALGCGDPVTLAELRPGQTVVDLGSGGGMDCFLAAREVGDEGRVIGVDMTPEMVARARGNLEKMQLSNVEFRLGEMERLPVEDASVDVVLSNCAVNLSPNPEAVFREAFRVLKPGGVLAVSDVMLDRPMPELLRSALAGGGADLENMPHLGQYLASMEAAGFEGATVSRTYFAPEGAPATSGLAGEGGDPGPRRARMTVRIGETGETLGEVDLGSDVDLASIPRSMRGNIRARKPEARATGTASGLAHAGPEGRLEEAEER